MFAMPTFEVNSVIVPMNMETRKRMTKVGKCRNGTRASPILLAKQEAILPLDMANPPPRRNIKLQGIFVSITCHVINPSEDAVGLLVATQNTNSQWRTGPKRKPFICRID